MKKQDVIILHCLCGHQSSGLTKPTANDGMEDHLTYILFKRVLDNVPHGFREAA